MNAYRLEDFLERKRSFGASFSPDGNDIAFLSDLSGVAQIYVISLEGGETEQLTSYSDPIGDVAFSATKAELLFAMAEGGNERFQLYLLKLDSGATERLINNETAIHRFGGWSYDGKSITYSSNERNGTDFDIFVLDIVTKDTRCVFDQGGWCEAYGFSPDGTRLRFLSGIASCTMISLSSISMRTRLTWRHVTRAMPLTDNRAGSRTLVDSFS